jgi:hypothetical protein
MLELILEPHVKDVTKLREVLIDTGAGIRFSEGLLLGGSKMSLQTGRNFVQMRVSIRVYDKIQQQRHCYVIW